MPNCIVCHRKLNPGTSIPRWSEETLSESESNRKFYDEQVAQRKREIEEGRVGLYGEATFCNKDCATFFARGCVIYFKHVSFIPDGFHERIEHVHKLIVRSYKWVSDRMGAKK